MGGGEKSLKYHPELTTPRIVETGIDQYLLSGSSTLALYGYGGGLGGGLDESSRAKRLMRMRSTEAFPTNLDHIHLNLREVDKFHPPGGKYSYLEYKLLFGIKGESGKKKTLEERKI